MSVADTLAKHGYNPVRTDTTATCIFAPKEDRKGWEITTMQLHVRAEIPGIDTDTFEKIIEEADDSCPLSNLLRNGLEIQIDATLLQDETLKDQNSKV
jgi:osmotically inducible protein OsmC